MEGRIYIDHDHGRPQPVDPEPGTARFTTVPLGRPIIDEIAIIFLPDNFISDGSGFAS